MADDRGGPELVKIQAALRKKGYVAEGHGDALKTVPRGYDKDHPRGELLKQKKLFLTNATGHTPGILAAPQAP